MPQFNRNASWFQKSALLLSFVALQAFSPASPLAAAADTEKPFALDVLTYDELVSLPQETQIEYLIGLRLVLEEAVRIQSRVRGLDPIFAENFIETSNRQIALINLLLPAAAANDLLDLIQKKSERDLQLVRFKIVKDQYDTCVQRLNEEQCARIKAMIDEMKPYFDQQGQRLDEKVVATTPGISVEAARKKRAEAEKIALSNDAVLKKQQEADAAAFVAAQEYYAKAHPYAAMEAKCSRSDSGMINADCAKWNDPKEPLKGEFGLGIDASKQKLAEALATADPGTTQADQLKKLHQEQKESIQGAIAQGQAVKPTTPGVPLPDDNTCGDTTSQLKCAPPSDPKRLELMHNYSAKNGKYNCLSGFLPVERVENACLNSRSQNVGTLKLNCKTPGETICSAWYYGVQRDGDVVTPFCSPVRSSPEFKALPKKDQPKAIQDNCEKLSTAAGGKRTFEFLDPKSNPGGATSWDDQVVKAMKWICGNPQALAAHCEMCESMGPKMKLLISQTKIVRDCNKGYNLPSEKGLPRKTTKSSESATRLNQ